MHPWRLPTRALICILLVPLWSDAAKPGQAVYEHACATCHGADGMGWHEKNGPTLIGVDWVTGDADRLVRLTLGGLYQRIPLGNSTHYGVMPGFKDLLGDAQIADVLSFIRSSWGNAAPAIRPSQVTEARARLKDGGALFTAADFHLEVKGKSGPAGEALMPPGRFAQDGFRTYLAICVGCHQLNGRGMATGNGHGFPPLVGSDIVNGPQNTLIRVVLGGLEGKNNPPGGPQNETMPPWGMGMSDAQIAQVLTFVRQAWGHTRGAVSVNAVANLRIESTLRQGRPWNTADLQKAAEQDALRDESTTP